jgi:hypothetical protein
MLMCTAISLGVPAAAGEGDAMVKVVLSDGQELHGHLLAESPESVSVELASGGRLDLPRSSIRALEREEGAVVKGGAVWFQDPNRTRYFYAPSAMTLRAGEGYFSQKELAFSAVAYGVTDHITVLAGSALPLWFVPDGYGINFVGGVKVGFQAMENLHLAAGAESLVLPIFGDGSGSSFGGGSGMLGAGFVFGTGTFGTRDQHLSLAVGKPFLFYGSSSLVGDVIVVASGSLRVLPNLSLITENWIFPTGSIGNGEIPMLNSAGIRIMGNRLAADVGLIRIPGTPVPMPWLDFTYNFGG